VHFRQLALGVSQVQIFELQPLEASQVYFELLPLEASQVQIFKLLHVTSQLLSLL
jgi:hypothetical protein